jgi:hypothetical protein
MLPLVGLTQVTDSNDKGRICDTLTTLQHIQ